jgi:molybdate transport system ATP-binding protein
MMLQLQLHKRLDGAAGPMSLDFADSLPEKGILALMGPSGTGKTSILRMIAGLMRPDAGMIRVAGETWFDASRGINLPPQKRNAGFVFQNYSLFPNMTVLENLRFAAPKKAAPDLIDEILGLMSLSDLRHTSPLRLSGGQQQRIALARAIVQRPRILLLDEPLAALDAATRIRLQNDLKALHHRFGFTTVIVSHDVNEVVRIADRVAIIDQGKVSATGHPAALFARDIGEQRSGEIVLIESGESLTVLSESGIWRFPWQAGFQVGDQVSMRGDQLLGREEPPMRS